MHTTQQMNKLLTVINVMSSCAQIACANKANWQQQALTVISHMHLMSSPVPIIFYIEGISHLF